MNKLNPSAVRWTWIALVVTALVVAGPVHATIVTVAPEHVNTLVGPSGTGGLETSVFDNNNNFSVHSQGPQETMVFNSTASLLTALQLVLGPAPAYRINSATLTVGTNTDNFAPGIPVSGYLVLTNYTPSQASYNNRLTGTPWATPGLGAGTDRGSTAVTLGVTSSFTTTFSGLGPVVQGWLDNTSPDFGLLFSAVGLETTAADFTDYHNVVWTLDADIVPEPSTVLLIGLGGLLLSRFRSASPGRARLPDAPSLRA